VTEIRISSSGKAATTLKQAGDSYTVISANIDVVEKTLRKLLDQGQNVYLTYENDAQFVDSKTGIMSISMFEIPEGGEPLSREQREYFNIHSGGHAVQVVGYDFDPKTNKVIKWKIKNSWGENFGDHGYYHMYNDYFRHFVTGLSFYSNSKGTPKIKKEDPVQLHLPL
jgi:bleomycin hydrolase